MARCPCSSSMSINHVCTHFRSTFTAAVRRCHTHMCDRSSCDRFSDAVLLCFFLFPLPPPATKMMQTGIAKGHTGHVRFLTSVEAGSSSSSFHGTHTVGSVNNGMSRHGKSGANPSVVSTSSPVAAASAAAVGKEETCCIHRRSWETGRTSFCETRDPRRNVV